MKPGQVHAEIAAFSRLDYANMGGALFEVLSRSRPDTDREAIEAWNKVFGVVADTMLQAGHSPVSQQTDQ